MVVIQGSKLIFVPRTDKQSYDFTKTSFTKDYQYHDLDLSAIVPKSAKEVLLWGAMKSTTELGEVSFAVAGYTGTYLKSIHFCQIAGVGMNIDTFIPVFTSQKIQYRISNINWEYVNLSVIGWLQ